MMKLVFLCLLPFVFCAPQERFVLDTILGGSSTFDLSTLKCDIQLMLDLLGSDPSEQQCETECHKLISDGNVFEYSCPLICHGFQSLVHIWHIVPDSTDPTVNRCAAGGQAVGK